MGFKRCIFVRFCVPHCPVMTVDQVLLSWALLPKSFGVDQDFDNPKQGANTGPRDMRQYVEAVKDYQPCTSYLYEHTKSFSGARDTSERKTPGVYPYTVLG